MYLFLCSIISSPSYTKRVGKQNDVHFLAAQYRHRMRAGPYINGGLRKGSWHAPSPFVLEYVCIIPNSSRSSWVNFNFTHYAAVLS